MANETILVVDDEPNIVELVRMYLTTEGYNVEAARTGREALDAIAADAPDLMILDLMLPEVDGWEVCRQVRAGDRAADLPIIMLTARDDDVDKIVGLELGADDYVTKPFNPRELTARVKAILRRAQRNVRPEQAIRIGNVLIDPARREVTVGGESVTLRRKEFDLLQAFAEHQSIVLSRKQLLEQVWGYDFYGETRTVDVHVGQLRKRLAESDVEIETVVGVGYKLVA